VGTMLDKLAEHRVEILYGEVGALLHDIGKLSQKWVDSQAEGQNPITHTAVVTDEFLGQDLKTRLESIAAPAGFPALWMYVRHHHRLPKRADCRLSLLRDCDRRDSADDKARTHKKQPPNEKVYLATVFGAETDVRPNLERSRGCLCGKLALWLGDVRTIADKRDSIVNAILAAYHDALGETRRPANDVRLSEHCWVVAALYKSSLARLALEASCLGSSSSPDAARDVQSGDEVDTDGDAISPAEPGVKWRLYGVGWNGHHLLSRSIKVQEMTVYQVAIEYLTLRIRDLVENNYPIGNRVYEDTNGLFVTFPDISDEKAKALGQEMSEKMLVLLRTEWGAEAKITDRQLWECSERGSVPTIPHEAIAEALKDILPFFSLTRPTTSMTWVAREIRRNAEVLSAGCFSSFFEYRDSNDHSRTHLTDSVWEDLIAGEMGPDRETCPVAPQWSKKARSKERLSEHVRKMREGRRHSWLRGALKGREPTIWLDEIKDEDNKLGLLKVRLELGTWLDGSQFTTNLSYGGDGVVPRNDALTHCVSALKAASNGDMQAAMRELAKSWKYAEQDGWGRTMQYACDFWEYHDSPWLSGPTQDPMALAQVVLQRPPSPSRIQRVWVTARETLALVENAVVDALRNTDERQRQVWQAELQQESQDARLGRAIEGEVWAKTETGEVFVGRALWVPNKGQGNRLVSISSWEALGDDLVEVRFKPDDDEAGVSADDSEGVPLSLSSCKTYPYTPCLTALLTPYELQFVFPAKQWITVSQTVRDMLKEQFHRVQGQLQQHIGMMILHHRFPLYSVLEAAERLLCHPDIAKQEAWDVRDVTGDKITFGNGLIWDKPPDLGCAIPDRYYQHMAVDNDESSSLKVVDLDKQMRPAVKLWEYDGTDWPRPVQKGDKMRISPSYFDFVYLYKLADSREVSYKRMPRDASTAYERMEVAYAWHRYGPPGLLPKSVLYLEEFWALIDLLGRVIGKGDESGAFPTTSQLSSLTRTLLTQCNSWAMVNGVDGVRDLAQEFWKTLCSGMGLEGVDPTRALEIRAGLAAAPAGMVLDAIALRKLLNPVR
jgi:hypothetical protein